jgi:DNA-binding MarR family transcriptional regulator
MRQDACPPTPAPGAGDDLPGETEQVIAAVMAASRLFVAMSARALAGVDTPLTLPQLRTLVVLRHQGPVKLAELAAALAVNPSSAMRTVDKLAALGLVDRQVNPDSRREVILRLTAPGEKLVDEVLACRHREVAGIVARLPQDQRSTLVQALQTLLAAAGRSAAEPFIDLPIDL